MDSAFINRPMSITLDLVRASAALAVLVGHAAQLGLYTGAWPFSVMLQHNAVVVFFVLSGLVIATSIERKQMSLPDYVVARCARILPVALFALAFTLTAFTIAGKFAPQSMAVEDFDHLTARIVLPLFFLSESQVGHGAVWNAPFWSLCYEVWYYALFGAAFFLRGRQRVLWLALLALIAGFKVLILLPIWLMGVGVARSRVNNETGALAAIGYLAAGLLMGVIATADAEPVAQMLFQAVGVSLHFSEHVLTDLLLGAAVTFGFVGLRPLADKAAGILQRCERPIRAAAGMSFTLYVLHWPMLLLLRSFSITAGESLPAFAGFLVAICLVCAAVATVIERKDFFARRIIEGFRPQLRLA
jgi:peptidoglycan/LPS O-acetylase OafA/YrhL